MGPARPGPSRPVPAWTPVSSRLVSVRLGYLRGRGLSGMLGFVCLLGMYVGAVPSRNVVWHGWGDPLGYVAKLCICILDWSVIPGNLGSLGVYV